MHIIAPVVFPTDCIVLCIFCELCYTDTLQVYSTQNTSPDTQYTNPDTQIQVQTPKIYVQAPQRQIQTVHVCTGVTKVKNIQGDAPEVFFIVIVYYSMLP